MFCMKGHFYPRLGKVEKEGKKIITCCVTAVVQSWTVQELLGHNFSTEEGIVWHSCLTCQVAMHIDQGGGGGGGVVVVRGK